MKEFEEITVTKKVTVGITCNKCGKYKKISEDGWEYGEFQSFSLSFGYGSKFDEERWKFDLCEQCLTDFIKTFKHAPKVYGY